MKVLQEDRWNGRTSENDSRLWIRFRSIVLESFSISMELHVLSY